MHKFTKILFGLRNTEATPLQRLMDIVLSGLHFQVCIVYIDDIILFLKATDEHLERLITMFGRLR